jgi:1,4-alpha-glucan branching enzyme
MRIAADAARTPDAVRHGPTLLTDQDLYLFNEGTHLGLADKLGAHPTVVDGVEGTIFAVWAPNAIAVSVVGDFNGWEPSRHPLGARATSGIWEGFVPELRHGTPYKYHVRSRLRGYEVDKADPVAFRGEVPPHTASIVWSLDYEWGDGEWMATQPGRNALEAPQAIYEVHLGSWRRLPEENNRSLGYREIAPLLADYATSAGFTHVELLPIMELPDHGLLRGDEPIRDAAGPHVPGGSSPPARPRRDPRLGAVALPD